MSWPQRRCSINILRYKQCSELDIQTIDAIGCNNLVFISALSAHVNRSQILTIVSLTIVYLCYILDFATESCASHSSCCRGRPTPLAYPNPWPMVQQLLHPIYQDTCFNTPKSPCQASHQQQQPPTTVLRSKHWTM